MSQHYSYAPYKRITQNFIVGFVSGALVSSIKNSAKETATQSEKIKGGFKTAVQSGLAAAMITEANERMISGRHIDAALFLGVGAVGVYAIEKASDAGFHKSGKPREPSAEELISGFAGNLRIN